MNRFRDVGEFGGAGGLMADGADGRIVLLHQRPEMGQDRLEARLARKSPLLGEFAQADIHAAIFAFSLPRGKGGKVKSLAKAQAAKKPLFWNFG